MATLIRTMLLFFGTLLVACEDPALVITVTRDDAKFGVVLRVCHSAPYCYLCTTGEEDQNVFTAKKEQSTMTRDVAIYFSDPPSPFTIQLDVDQLEADYSPEKDHLALDLEDLEWPVNLRLDFFNSKPPEEWCPDQVCSPWSECQH